MELNRRDNEFDEKGVKVREVKQSKNPFLLPPPPPPPPPLQKKKKKEKKKVSGLICIDRQKA